MNIFTFAVFCACTIAVLLVYLDTAHAQDCDNPLVIVTPSSEEIRFPKWKWTRATGPIERMDRYFFDRVECENGKADTYVACIRSKPDVDGKVEEICSEPSVPIVVPEPGQNLQLLAGLAALVGLGRMKR